ncbi:MAG: CpaF family protein [Actinobacteria bacterium]|nr:MAG: CpaF family protein [Actinomycetota bacterium]
MKRARTCRVRSGAWRRTSSRWRKLRRSSVASCRRLRGASHGSPRPAEDQQWCRWVRHHRSARGVVQGGGAHDRSTRPVLRAEDADPPRVHPDARAGALQERSAGRHLRACHARGHRAARARPHAADPRGAPPGPFLRDDSVTEVMVNNFDRIFVERLGKIERTNAAFADNAHLLRIIDKIVSTVGRRVDESSPMVDARLPDGSRVNAIIPPLSLKGPTLTIRKFSRDPYTMNDLISFGTITPKAGQFLAACVKGKLNILISGGTGTGKTTTLNAMSAFVPGDERIVTIEDAAELQLQQEHVITLESRPPNIEGQGEIRIRELVRNALRMRPDRIIVGEVRGPETLDMLQAMNTGHEGSLTTIHANSPRDALSRLETLVMTAGVELPHRAIREQIASAFDLLVQISRLVDGTRRITHITEVLRMESDVITLQDIFVAKPPDEETSSLSRSSRLLAPLACTGLKPHFLEKMSANGVALPPAFFEQDEGGLRPAFAAASYGGFK